MLKNKEDVLKKLYHNFISCIAKTSKIKSDQVILTFGAEFEFYLDMQKTSFDKFKKSFDKFQQSQDALNFFDEIEEEDGQDQFEIQTQPTTNPLDFVSKVNDLKNFLSQNNCIIKAKPYDDRPGSSVHYHISAYKKDGTNLFAKKPFFSKKYQRSELFLNSISGLLATALDAMIFFAPTENCYKRFKMPQDGDLFFYPTRLSWGHSNRTCAIRIPVSIKQSPSKARFEHRIASPMSDPFYVLISLLYGMLEGITKKPTLQPETFGNSFDHQYCDLKRIACSLDEARRDFLKSDFFSALKKSDL